MRSILSHVIAFQFITCFASATPTTSAGGVSTSSTIESSSTKLRIPALQSSLSRHLGVLVSAAGDDETQQHQRRRQRRQQERQPADPLTTSSCQNDMMELERNTDLSDSLQNALNSFSTDFNSNPLQYCTTSSSSTIQSSGSTNAGGTRQLDCFVDFSRFSSDYKSICRDFEAEHIPVTLFLQCSSSAVSDHDVTLEMELANIPTCLAHQCDRVQVGIALDRLLSESNEQSDSNGGNFGGFTCTLYRKTNQFYEVSSAASTTTSNLGITTAAILLFGIFNLVAFGI